MNRYRPEANIEDDQLKDEEIYKGEINGEQPPTIKEFDSTEEMLDFIRHNLPLWKPKKRGVHITEWSKPNDESGADDWKAALYLANHGWPEGRKLLTQAESRNVMTGIAKTKKWQFNVAGAIPDIPRYVAGDIEHMIDFLPSNHGQKPTISICVSPMCPATVTPQQRANWGAALLSWIEAEEVMGNRVQIRVIYASSPGWIVEHKRAGKIVVKYRLQADGIRRSVEDLSFWLMHNAAHLRIQFAIKERLDRGMHYSSNPPYGNAVNSHEGIEPYLDSDEILLVLGHGADSVSEGLRMIYDDIERHRKKTLA